MKVINSNFLIKFSTFSIAIICLVGCVNIFKLSDLRTDSSSEINNIQYAKQLLNEMGKAHGIENWKNIETYTINFSDEFYGFIGQQGNPFKSKLNSLSLSYIPNTPNGQIEILNGREYGSIWGVQDEQAYTIVDDELMKTEDQDVKFWVPTYQYFIEFPMRIQNASSISYAGKDTINGVICEGVIASWKTIKPQKEIDQYLIWLDSKTHQITKLEYTIRDINKYITGATYFKNYNNYDGIILPTEFHVTSNLVKKGLLHKMSIYSFNKNYMQINSLLPLNNEE